jgi:rhodanese-related sulfurtransferase
MIEVKSAFRALVDDAKAQIKEVTMSKVKQMLDDKLSDGIVIDVREDSEYKTSHLPNTIHLSRGLIEVKIEKEIPNKEQKLYLYCGSGSRSALATLNLQKMGYKNVVSISGGFREWINLSK